MCFLLFSRSAEDKSTKDIVAVKSFKVDHEVATEGFPASVLREINILRSYPHSNIVALRDVVPNFKKNRSLSFFALLAFSVDSFPGIESPPYWSMRRQTRGH